ncbi:hypothetical protein B0T12DRAFT_393499 [Alternaria alternata]|nr:hypothetical protein B0T12DRAFT_393499 [Alternaria alternata]
MDMGMSMLEKKSIATTKTMRSDTRKSAGLPSFGYREGYHDPILKDQTEDWWKLFGHDVPKQFILGAESTRMVDKEWNVAAYFAPYRTPKQESCPRPERECRDGKNHAVKEGGESGNELSTGEIGGGIPRAGGSYLECVPIVWRYWHVESTLVIV